MNNDENTAKILKAMESIARDHSEKLADKISKLELDLKADISALGKEVASTKDTVAQLQKEAGEYRPLRRDVFELPEVIDSGASSTGAKGRWWGYSS